MPANFSPGWYDEYLYADADDIPLRAARWRCVGCHEEHCISGEAPETDEAENAVPWLQSNPAGLYCRACAERVWASEELDEEGARAERQARGVVAGWLTGDPYAIYGEPR